MIQKLLVLIERDGVSDPFKGVFSGEEKIREWVKKFGYQPTFINKNAHPYQFEYCIDGSGIAYLSFSGHRLDIYDIFPITVDDMKE